MRRALVKRVGTAQALVFLPLPRLFKFINSRILERRQKYRGNIRGEHIHILKHLKLPPRPDIPIMAPTMNSLNIYR